MIVVALVVGGTATLVAFGFFEQGYEKRTGHGLSLDPGYEFAAWSLLIVIATSVAIVLGTLTFDVVRQRRLSGRKSG